VTFERNVQPQAADFSNSVVVRLGGSPVAGSVAETSDGVLTWTPGAALAAGTYDVTVYNVRSEWAMTAHSRLTPSRIRHSVTSEPSGRNQP